MLRDGYEYNENYQRDKVREENSKSFMKWEIILKQMIFINNIEQIYWNKWK